MKTFFALIVFSMLLCFSCNPVKEKTGTSNAVTELKGDLRISGAYALGPLMNIWAEKFMILNPGLKIVVVENGTGSGISDLSSGKSNLAMASINLTPEQEEKGLWKTAVSREGVIPIINDKNPLAEALMKKGLKRNTLAGLFSGKGIMTWGDATGTEDKSRINVYIRADQSGAAAIWSGYLDIPLKELKGKALEGDTSIIAAICKDPLGLSFCNAHYAYDSKTDTQLKGLRVLPVDFNGNGMIDQKEDIFEKVSKLHRAAYLGTYPSHLCRELSLVCNSKPTDPNIIEFIKWILTDGQEIAVKAGYCEIRSCDKEEVIKNLTIPE